MFGVTPHVRRDIVINANELKYIIQIIFKPAFTGKSLVTGDVVKVPFATDQCFWENKCDSGNV